MGWAEGSELAQEIWNFIRKDINPDRKKKFAIKLIDMMEDRDCDTMYECDEIQKAAGNKKCSECDSWYTPVSKTDKFCEYCTTEEV